MGQDPFFGEEGVIPKHATTHALCYEQYNVSSLLIFLLMFCRHAHDGVPAGAVGEAHGCSRGQPVHLPFGGHHQPWKPHQGDKGERHEGERLYSENLSANYASSSYNCNSWLTDTAFGYKNVFFLFIDRLLNT